MHIIVTTRESGISSASSRARVRRLRQRLPADPAASTRRNVTIRWTDRDGSFGEHAVAKQTAIDEASALCILGNFVVLHPWRSSPYKLCSRTELTFISSFFCLLLFSFLLFSREPVHPGPRGSSPSDNSDPRGDRSPGFYSRYVSTFEVYTEGKRVRVVPEMRTPAAFLTCNSPCDDDSPPVCVHFCNTIRPDALIKIMASEIKTCANIDLITI